MFPPQGVVIEMDATIIWSPLPVNSHHLNQNFKNIDSWSHFGFYFTSFEILTAEARSPLP